MFNDYVDIIKKINMLEGKEEFDSVVLVVGIGRMSLTINRIKSYLRLCDILKKEYESNHFKAFSDKIKISEFPTVRLYSVPCKLEDMDGLADIEIHDGYMIITYNTDIGDDITKIIKMDCKKEITNEQKVVLKTVWKFLEDQINEFEKLAEELLSSKEVSS